MNTKENSLDNFGKFYLKEFTFFDGDNDITFNIVNINFEKKTIEVAISNQGKISVVEYDLIRDKNDELYFEYGYHYNFSNYFYEPVGKCKPLDKIYLNAFENVED